MDFSEMQDYVADELDDVLFGYFPRAKVKDWLNFAQLETQKLLLQTGEQWYTTLATQSTTTNARRYALPSDFLKVQRFELVLSGISPNQNIVQLEPITLNEQNLALTGPSTPLGYYLRRRYFELVPIPSDEWALNLYYSYRVADMVLDTDEADVPIQYQELIPLIAARNGFTKDNRDPSILNDKIKFYTDMMKQDAEDRREDAPRSIVITNPEGYDFVY